MPNSAEELDLIERFIVAYNQIDAHLQDALNEGNSFRSLVDIYAKKHRWWRDAELLRTAAGLRNLLVHEKTKPYEYPCVPTGVLVSQVEAARDRLLYPQRAVPRFERDVTTIQADDSLAHVLQLIHGLQYTHFPVYEYSAAGDSSRFLGVLTENGITRWLAERIAVEGSLVELKEETAREVLRREEKRRNVEFASRQTRIEEIVYRFHENMYLEVVLITSNGREKEELLGIVTRWDALGVD